MYRLVGLALFAAMVLAITATMLTAPARQAPAEISAPALAQRPTPAAPATGFAGADTVVVRDGSGLFRLPAQVNGVDTQFLVDSGADTVALTVADAERFGIPVQPGDYQPIVRSAAGIGRGARVTLDRLDVAGQELRGVDAVVVEGLTRNALGRPVLARLGTIVQQGDRMVVHPE